MPSTYDEVVGLSASSGFNRTSVQNPPLTWWFSGGETGDITEFQNVVGNPSVQPNRYRTGAYALQCNAGDEAGPDLIDAITLLPQIQFFRGYVYTDVLPKNETQIWEMTDQYNQPSFRFKLKNDGTVTGYTVDTFGEETLQGTSSGLFSAQTWNLVETRVINSSVIGTIVLRLNHTEEFNITNQDFSNSFPTTRWMLGPLDGEGLPFFYDDLICGLYGWFGDGGCIARQPTTGQPVYDDFKKVPANETIGLLWNQTPFDINTYAYHDVLFDFSDTKGQTASVYPFNKVQKTLGIANHGNEVLSDDVALNATTIGAVGQWDNPSSYINAPQLALWNQGVTTLFSIREEGSSSNFGNDVPLYRSSSIIPQSTISLSQLSQRPQIGIKFNISDATEANRINIYDVWLMVDYKPAPLITLMSHARFHVFGHITHATPTEQEPIFTFQTEVIP